MEIGTVEILRTRIYDRSPEDSTEMLVAPGVYPLFFEDGEYFWFMDGHFNERGVQSLGGGMFLVNQGDVPSDEHVVFSSPRFTPEAFEDMGVVREEGHPEQRLRITVFEEARCK